MFQNAIRLPVASLLGLSVRYLFPHMKWYYLLLIAFGLYWIFEYWLDVIFSKDKRIANWLYYLIWMGGFAVAYKVLIMLPEQ